MHLEYECCKLEDNQIRRHYTRYDKQLPFHITDYDISIFSRFLKSSPSCGRRGRKRIERKFNDSNSLEEDEELDGRIVKDGRNPFRTVGGIVTQRHEIPWQVQAKHEKPSFI